MPFVARTGAMTRAFDNERQKQTDDLLARIARLMAQSPLKQTLSQLKSVDNDCESAGVQLLRDLQRLFEERDHDRITSADLVEALAKMGERPWPE